MYPFKTIFSTTMTLLVILSTTAQNKKFKINEEIISKLPEKVTIIGLGDPTHQESNITEFRVDLIKKLVNEKNFKIIAIEGNMYSLYKAHKEFMHTNDISNIERAMYSQLNLREMEELYHFVYEKNQKGDSILITGFDINFSSDTFAEKMEDDLKKIDFLSDDEKKDFVKQLEKAQITNLKALFRNNKKVKSNVSHYVNLILSKFQPKTQADYIFEQALRNLQFVFTPNSDESSHNLRDMAMFNNLKFFREIYPNQKIILFGSTTHLHKSSQEIYAPFFQNNRKALGDLLHQNYQDDYYFIAYSGLSGEKYNDFLIPVKIPELDVNSIEYKYKDVDSVFYLDKSNASEEKLSSRIMGHSFLEMNIWNVMDGLVLIQNIKTAKIKKRQKSNESIKILAK